MSDYTGPDHVVTVTIDPYWHFDNDSKTWLEGVNHEVTHPTDCDTLKYGELCALDCWLNDNGVEDLPDEPGVYTVSYWSSGPDHNGEYDGGLNVEKRDEKPAEVVAEVATDPWVAIAP